MNSSAAFLDVLYKDLLEKNCSYFENFSNESIRVTQLRDCLSATSNANDSEISAFYFYQTEQLAFLWLLFIFIVVGNSSVLLALVLAKGRKSRMNFFITHLALADLSVGLISVATDIAWKMTVAWHAGNIACKLIRFFQVLVTYSSTYVLIALSIDRCDAITHPMNFSGGWRRARILVSSSWILSAVFSSPILFLYEQKIIQGQPQCWIDLQEQWQWQLYISLVCLTVFILPTVIISACYLVIVYTIWKKSSSMDQARLDTRANPSPGTGGSKPHGREELEKRVSSRGVIPRAKMKTVKMTFVIVTVFVLSWSPYIIFDLLQVFGHIPNTQTMVAVATFIQSLAPLNSATNPIVYCLFSTRLCRNLRRIPLFDWFARKTIVCIRCQTEVGTPTYQTVKGKPLLYNVARTTSSDPTQSTSISNSVSSQLTTKQQTSINVSLGIHRSEVKEQTGAEDPTSPQEAPVPEFRRSRFARRSLTGDLNCERQRYARAKSGDESAGSIFDFEGEVVDQFRGTKCPLAEPNLLNAVATPVPLI